MIFKLIILFLMSSMAMANSKFEMTTFNYPPLITKEKLGFVDILFERFKVQSGLTITLKKYPNRRASHLYTIHEKPIFLGGLGVFTKEILDESEIIPLFEYKIKLVQAKISHKSFRDIKTVGIQHGSIGQIKALEKRGIKYIKAKTMQELLSLLLIDRVDAIACVRIACSHTIKRQGLDVNNFKFSKENLVEAQAAILINKTAKNYKELSDELRPQIQKFLRSQSYMELLRIYFGKEIPEDYLKYTK